MKILNAYIILGLSVIALIGCNKGKNNPTSCNGSSTRRDIKLLIDDAASEIDTVHIFSNVNSLEGMDLIEAKKDTHRNDIEKKVFTVTANVKKLSKHRDGDYKVKLESDDENYLNCEAPNVGCEFASASLFYEQFKVVREFIELNEDDIEGKTVTITGVGFIDIEHNYPRNAAANDFELHPILDIHF